MKPIITLFLAVMAFSIPFNAAAIETAPAGNSYMELTAGDIVDMNAREFKELTGTKLSFKDRIVFGLVKNQLKRGLKNGDIQMDSSASDAAAAVEGSFNFGAFILGFLLGLLGFLIVILAFKDKGAWKWALAGMGLWLILVLLFFI